MSALLRCALLLAAVLGSGAAAVRLAFRAPAAGLPERILRGALALLMGAGLVSAASGALLLLFGARGALADLVVLGLSAPLLLFARRGPAEPAPPAPPLPRWLWSLCAAALAVFALIFLEHSVRYPDGAWDATAIWNLRARALLRSGTDLGRVFPPGEQVPHPDYPLLLPGLLAHVWSALGAESPLAPPLAAALYCGLLLTLLAAGLAAAHGPREGALGLLLLLGTPTLLTHAIAQYADVPLAAYLLAAALLSGRALSRPEGAPRLLALAGLCASLAAWTKNEGLLALLLLAALLAAQRRRFREPAAFLLGALPVLLLLAWFKLRWAPPNDLVVSSNAAGLRARLLDPARALLIAREYARRLWSFPEWGAGLAVVALSWPASWWTHRNATKDEAGALLTRFSLLLPLAYAGVFLLTPQGLQWHLDSSLDRLLLHAWPVALLAYLPLTRSASRPPG